MPFHYFAPSRRQPRFHRPRLESLEDRSLLAPVADIVNVTPDPRTGPVGQVVINFTDSDTHAASAVTGVDQTDFTLTRDGANVPLGGVPLNGSGDTYAIDLASVTTSDGVYVLTLNASGSGIMDAGNAPLADDAVDSWTISTAGPTADIVDITPDPRTTPVGNVAINFSEPVFNVTIDDFSLTRNGVNVPLTGLVVNGSGLSYTLNLSTVTAASGSYVLTLVAAGSGITDANGFPLTANASDTFSSDTAPPTADIIDVTPDPRTTAVSSISVVFSEPVSGVDIADFSLTRNGTAVALTGVTVSGTGASYTLNNLTTVTTAAGTYVLTLSAANSGITDVNGNALTLNASDTWVNDTTLPTATIVPISPDPRTTPVGTVTINFSEPVTGVDRSDFTLTLNGVPISLAGVPLSGSGATYTLNLTSVTQTFGNYVLTLVAAGSGITDSAGNALTANASDSWTIDDAGEQNDTLRTATNLGRLNSSVTFGPLGLVDANDWYRFTTVIKGGPNDSVSISFLNAEGDLDLELYNVSGQRLRVASTANDGERISLNGLPAGTYYIRVFGFRGAVNPNYSLTIDAPHPLVDDTLENNDTRATASNFGTLTSAVTVSNLVMIDGHDWYRFTTTAKGTAANQVAIHFQNAQGNLNLELYNSRGARVASSSTTRNSEQISLSGRAAGTYYVHVIGVNGAHNGSYSLQINPPSPAAFNIALQVSGLKANQIATMEQAAQKWQTIIIADLPSATYFASGSTSGVTVDDLLIDVSSAPIDGVGNIIGGSEPDALRAGSDLPYHGFIVFDTADLTSLQANGTLTSAAEHEIAHVLGFGAIWAAKGLLTGAGTSDPEFIGSQAVAAYNSIFGTAATGVPVDNTGIEGTADSHWSESVLGDELMTGFIDPGTLNPLSRITIAAMADLGYIVNLAAADAYAKPLLPAPTLIASSLPTGAITAARSSPGTHASALRSTPAAIDAVLTDWSWLPNHHKS